MRPTPLPTRLRSLLRADAGLAALVPEAERIRRLNHALAATVSPQLARACQIVAVQGGEVMAFCSSGATAARLRSQSASVLRALGRVLPDLAELRVKVRADWAVAPQPEKTGMSRQAVQAWQALAAELPEDDGLKQAVARLIQHQREGGKG